MLFFWLFVYSAIATSFVLFLAEHFFEWQKHLWRKSKCDHCGSTLHWAQLIPIFSFLRQRGKAICCHNRLRLHYVVLEVVSPLFICLLYVKYNFSISFFYYLLLFIFLLFFTVTDYLYMYIPLRYLYFLLVILFIWNLTNWPFYQSLLLCSIFYACLYLLFHQGIGSGDIQLLIIYSAALGWRQGYILFTGAVLIGLISLLLLVKFKKISNSAKAPFVPFIFISYMGIILF